MLQNSIAMVEGEVSGYKTLVCYQIYYSLETAKNCFKESNWWRLYDRSSRVSPYFENDVIKEIVAAGHGTGFDYLGIFSHAIGSKITFKENGLLFNPENLKAVISKGEADFYSFQKRRSNKNIVHQAEQWHPGITGFTKSILEKIGYSLPDRLDRIVLFNHFVARREVYDRYVHEMLIPAMNVMANMPELYGNAGYKTDPPKGFNHWPYHPFILERLPSVWLQFNKEVTFKHIF